MYCDDASQIRPDNAAMRVERGGFTHPRVVLEDDVERLILEPVGGRDLEFNQLVPISKCRLQRRLDPSDWELINLLHVPKLHEVADCHPRSHPGGGADGPGRSNEGTGGERGRGGEAEAGRCDAEEHHRCGDDGISYLHHPDAGATDEGAVTLTGLAERGSSR